MKEMVYFTVYETTNLVNGNKYRGVHKTTNMLDSYLGSGKILREAIKKYGRESFHKEIIFCAFTEKFSYEVEEFLVDKEWCDRRDTYNICIGGSGGVGSLNKGKKLSKEHIAKGAAWRKGRKLSQSTKDKISAGNKGLVRTPEQNAALSARNKGRRLSDADKLQRSVSGKGLMWITDGTSNSKTRDIECIPIGWYLGKTSDGLLGRKLINDGALTRYILSTDALPDGWNYGKIRKACTEAIEHDVPVATN